MTFPILKHCSSIVILAPCCYPHLVVFLFPENMVATFILELFPRCVVRCAQDRVHSCESPHHKEKQQDADCNVDDESRGNHKSQFSDSDRMCLIFQKLELIYDLLALSQNIVALFTSESGQEYLCTFNPVTNMKGTKRKRATMRPTIIELKIKARKVRTEGCIPTTVWPTVWQYLHLTVTDLVKPSFTHSRSCIRRELHLHVAFDK